jgi:DmsE family decaheme c-type cytochrome
MSLVVLPSTLGGRMPTIKIAQAAARLAVVLGLDALALAGAFFISDAVAQLPQRQDKVFPGDAKCTRCHDETGEYPILDIANTRHGGAAKVSGMTCTSCHGDSDAHLARPGLAEPDRVFGNKGARVTPPSVREQACLTCHASDRHLAFWESGRHKKNDVACDNCHVIHLAKNTPLRKDNPSITPLVTTARQLQYETCTACHKQIRGQLLKTSHHPIMEGKLNCTSCHNPHGALSHAMVKEESVNQLCTGCHADKRGPFMQEHPPVEENCLTCHNSHGSNHNKLLSERVPNLCQDCHDAARHPGTFYSGNQGFGSPATGAPNTRLIARACLSCHTNIHGSNAPAMRGKFFLR